MKILFLCGSLEPGRDGVGDYARHLSGELSKQGHNVSAIALNDQHLLDVFFGIQIAENESITVLRLPSLWKASKRFARAEQWVHEFNPDWISLQFVPFAFHTKGLPFFLSKQLLSIGTGRRWHIMFHELWVGMNVESSKKQQFWGRLQRYLIKNLIINIKPKCINTHTQIYQKQLKTIGFKNELLPIFSNIPVIDYRKSSFDSMMARSSFTKNINLVVFGSIHPSTPINELAHDAALYAKQKLVSITLNIVGRCGPEQDRWVDSWQSVGLPVNVLGEQSAENVSKILHSSSLGITTTPLALVEKSGTVAAMREHNLPILCVTYPWTPLGIEKNISTTDVYIYEKGNFEIYLINKLQNNTKNNISNISSMFLSELRCIS